MTQNARVAHWIPTVDPAVGNAIIASQTANAERVVTTAFAQTTAGTGIPEAPADGAPYVRENFAWTKLDPELDGGTF